MPKRTGSTPTYKYLVANLAGGSNPSKGQNPVKVRSVFEQQQFIETPRGAESPDVVVSANQPGTSVRTGHVQWAAEPTPTASEGTLTVANNTFAFPAVISLGEFTLTSGVDFAVGGGVAATATNIATAIGNLPGFTATPVGAVVTVNGPSGPTPIRFQSEDAGNFTLVPNLGVLTPGDPVIGPPVIT